MNQTSGYSVICISTFFPCTLLTSFYSTYWFYTNETAYENEQKGLQPITIKRKYTMIEEYYVCYVYCQIKIK